MQFGPDARARLKGEQANAFAAVAERQYKQARAAVLARVGIADRGAGAVIDLRFLARLGDDDRASFGRSGAAQFAYEALDAFIGAGEAVPVHHLLPDRHGVAAAREPILDEFAEGFADAGGSCWWCRRCLLFPLSTPRQSRWSPHWPVLPPAGRWSPRWPVLAVPSCPSLPAVARPRRRPSNTRQPFRGVCRWPSESAAATSLTGPGR